ncbi:MAG: hypothetical protein BWK79_11415 [Beggiatoa sp. IS2]|nr:MAG: hypothetical protein BWK79_11415 [Beggiatoa sp. IS2]
MNRLLLDHPQVLQVLFHPRREYEFFTRTPGVFPVSVPVDSTVSLTGRLYPATATSPVILFFHGNGEIASDYDDLSQLYRQMGITLLVIDYRGYGMSGGSPTGTHLLTDAPVVFAALGNIFARYQLIPSQCYVMGRSLGSVPALEVAIHAGHAIAGLIIESGFASILNLLNYLGLTFNEIEYITDEFGNAEKITRINVPLLIIHGQEDQLIPLSEGEELYRLAQVTDKRLVTISNAGHNDLIVIGMTQYFGAIKTFVESVTPPNLTKKV